MDGRPVVRSVGRSVSLSDELAGLVASIHTYACIHMSANTDTLDTASNPNHVCVCVCENINHAFHR